MLLAVIILIKTIILIVIDCAIIYAVADKQVFNRFGLSLPGATELRRYITSFFQ